MNDRQMHILSLRNTDVDGAIRRCCGNEQLYVDCLRAFLEDQSIGELNRAVKSKAWDDAFTAAHAIKGLAGNMGFVPLMHAASQLVIIIRGGRVSELEDSMENINSCYRDINDAINDFLDAEH